MVLATGYNLAYLSAHPYQNLVGVGTPADKIPFKGRKTIW
jgi:hypothetical protein